MSILVFLATFVPVKQIYITIMTHLIYLSSSQNEFLRLLLLDAMRHYSREIDADVTLYTSVDDDDDMQQVFTLMLDTDRSNLDTAKKLYEKLLNHI